METNNIESQIYGWLIEKETQEMYRLLSTPEFQKKALEFTKEFCNSLASKLSEGTLSDAEKLELEKELVPEIESKFQNQFQNPEQLRKMASQAAKNIYMTPKELEKNVTRMCNELSKDEEFGEEAIFEFRKSHLKTLELSKYNDRIIKGLAEVARKDGIEKAMTDEATYSVIRSIFPTADDYVAFQDKFRKAGKKYLTDVQKAMTMDGELGMIIGNFVGALQEATEQFKEFIEDYRVEKAKKDVQKIYKSNHLSDT